MSVRTCGCGAPVYELRAGQAVVVLDTVDHPAGTWMPEPDGRTAVRSEPVPDTPRCWGYREHVCDRLPDGQGALFAGDGD